MISIHIHKYLRIAALLLLPALAAPMAFAQAPWTLQQCVDYAVSHNLAVKAREIQAESSREGVTAAKDAFLPSLSASASEGINFGRGLTAQNTYADRNTSQFQWGVQASLPLFQGLSNVRNLKVAEAQLTQALTQIDAAKDDITLNVMAQYLQALFSKEVIEASRSQLAHSTYEVERQRALTEAGKIAEAVLFDAEAQQAQDSLQLINARNDLRVALTNLANLLQLRDTDGFDVALLREELPIIPSPETVFARALDTNRSLQAARLGIDVADSRISLARSGYIPKLNFDASIGSSYYNLAGSENAAFGTQMKNNFSTYLGFRLTVPIFDAFSTRNSIRRAKIEKTSAQLDLDQRESDLYKDILLAHTQAIGARDKYLASEVTLEKTRLSFEATQGKYSLGRATPYEFEQAKTNLFRVEVSRIQAYYEYLLRARILHFYETATL